MVFTSPIFLFYFLPLVLALYYALPAARRNVFLTLASYVFYGWWSPWFVTLMLASTVIDYGAGKVITAPGASDARRRAGVFVSIAANLSLLGFFKYFVFAQENLNRLIELFGGEPTVLLTIVLPVGISFYSFQSMSYSVDLYRREAEPARSLLDFACYVAMFPQLVAGPIVRYREIYEQLGERPGRGELFRRGALNFMIGFAKKLLIANTVGEIADQAFAAGSLPAHVAWFGLVAYAFQIYFDCSGYSDMAIGLGQMFGFQLPINFRSPYRSESITDFWRRWHISLSTWLRDYLYIPLGGNRKGVRLTYRNLALTMLLGGFWHGAQWTFVAWGAFHGLALGLERMAGQRPVWSRLPRALRVATTYLLVLFSWVLFRAEDMGAAASYFGALFAGAGSPSAGAVLAATVYQPFALLVMLIAGLIVWGGRETTDVVRRAEASAPLSAGVLGLFCVAILAMFLQSENPFLYFQF